MADQLGKTISAVLQLLRSHAAVAGKFGGALSAEFLAALAKSVKIEISDNRAFADSLRDVLFPDSVADPVVVLQRGGEQELQRRLNRLSVKTLRQIAKSCGLASAKEIKNLDEPALVELLIERSHREASALRGC